MVKQLQEVFSNGYQIKFFITQYKAHAIELTLQALSQRYSHIICIGGDGTLNEVVNGVMEANDEDKKHFRIGLLPKGTGNDCARTLHITDDIAALKKSIDEDLAIDIDLGKANFIDVNGNPGSRFFINITDVGLGGDIVKKMESSSNWMGTFLTFQKAIVTTLLKYKKQIVTAKSDDLKYKSEIMVFAIANGKYFGGGLGIAPDAVVNDGKFSIVTAGNISIIQYLKFLGKLRSCKKIIHPELKYYTASDISLQSNIPLPIDMDGEFIGYTPLRVTIIPKAIKMLSHYIP